MTKVSPAIHIIGVALKEKPTLARPPLFKVIALNDDYTPQGFVIEILQRFFNRTPSDAKQIMMIIHNEGKGVCGVYPRDVAETKLMQAINQARAQEFPLQLKLEEAND
tara:strand:- start:25 stop:348 length:324 start_codon:yes stop_codon:yes gene_type:complete